jgi:condensin complex subunit 2
MDQASDRQCRREDPSGGNGICADWRQKINANNAFNFALIDYFHDMSLLKEGDGISFQKASVTLDGCVKIYTSRVDSINTDTSKLLSGLAESGNKKKRGGDAEGSGDEDEDGEDGEEGEDGQKKKKKRAPREKASSLADSFEQLQIKKMDLDLSVDPLFKKASADFDEGGAKGLLLNHLSIDSNGRIVFDSSDDIKDATQPSRETPAPERLGQEEDEEEETDEPSEDAIIDISGLAARYFPDLSRVDDQDICPSMKAFELGDASASTDLPFLKAVEDDEASKQDEDDEAANQSGMFLDGDNAPDFGDDGDVGFDLPPETGFGEGGELWANQIALEPQARVHNIEEAEGDEEGGEAGDGEPSADDPYALTHNQKPGQEQENILSYFDEALKKNWAGPEHWRIRRVKDVGKPVAPTKRKEKEPFKIDFFSPMSQELANALYAPAPSAASIMLPKSQWKSKTRNLAPDDKHFNSRQLLRLFLKPNVRLGAQRASRPTYVDRPSATPSNEPDAAQWAALADEKAAADEELVPQNDYDADFFEDGGLPMAGAIDDDGETFADARDHFSPPPATDNMVPMSSMGGAAATEEGAFGTQLVSGVGRPRPIMLNYARKAKNVDVRLLKDNIWTGMGLEKVCLTIPLNVQYIY